MSLCDNAETEHPGFACNHPEGPTMLDIGSPVIATIDGIRHSGHVAEVVGPRRYKVTNMYPPHRWVIAWDSEIQGRREDERYPYTGPEPVRYDGLTLADADDDGGKLVVKQEDSHGLTSISAANDDEDFIQINLDRDGIEQLRDELSAILERL